MNRGGSFKGINNKIRKGEPPEGEYKEEVDDDDAQRTSLVIAKGNTVAVGWSVRGLIRGVVRSCLLIREVVYYLALHRNLHLNCSVRRLCMPVKDM